MPRMSSRSRDKTLSGSGATSSSSSESGSTNDFGSNNVTNNGTNVTNNGNPVTFGGPQGPSSPSYNPNLIGQYFGYFNPDYPGGPNQEIGGINVNDMMAASEESTLDSFAGQNLTGAQQAAVNAASGNNFFSNAGGLSNLMSSFNMGNVLGSVIGNAIFPGIGGILGGYIGNTYGDDDDTNNFFGNLGQNIRTDFNRLNTENNLTDTEIENTPVLDKTDIANTDANTTLDNIGTDFTAASKPVPTSTTSYNPFSTDFSYRDIFQNIFSPYQEGGRVGYNDGGITSLLNLSGNVGRSGGENYDFFEANPSISMEDLELYANLTGNKDEQMLNELGANYNVTDDLSLNVGMNPNQPQEFSDPEDTFFARLTKSFNQGGRVQHSQLPPLAGPLPNGIGNLFKMK